MQLVASNNAQSNLASSITDTATSVTLTSGTGALFPDLAANQYFVATFTDAATGLLHEIVWVTAISTDTLTIERAQEDTEALPWSSGDLFGNLMTAGQLETLTQPLNLQQQTGNSAADSGSANVLVATLSPAPVSLASMNLAPIRIKKSNAANTGAATLNLNGFGATTIANADGSALSAGELPANGIFTVIYDTGSGNFILQTPATAAVVSQSYVQLQASNYAADTGTANALVMTLSPVPASLASLIGAPVRIKKTGAANTGAVTINVNALGATAIVDLAGNGMTSGQLPANALIEVVYNGTAFVLQSATVTPTTQQQQPGNYTASDTGSANAVVIAMVPAPASLAAIAGAPIRFQKSNNTNTGAVTLALNGLAATAIIRPNGNALTAGQLPANIVCEVIYNAAAAAFVLQTPTPPSSYTTAQYTPNTGTVESEAHGLGAVPSNLTLSAYMECLTAENGYSIGDVVTVTAGIIGGNADAFTAWVNGTDVGFAICTTAAFSIANKGTGVASNITPAHWGFFVVVRFN